MIKIEKEPDRVLPYANVVASLADSRRDSFGFLPKPAYSEKANKGQLWLALDDEADQVAGYIMFGGTFPYLTVSQIFVAENYSRRRIGTQLFSELKHHAICNNYLYISAKVATELPANRFWHRMGLRICDQIPPKSGKRAKNVYVLELTSGSLFTTSQTTSDDFKYSNDTQLRNMRFVVDLNVYFDVVKNRKHADEALRVFHLGLTGRLKLAITEEFLTELKRNSPVTRTDPLLELAQALPCWPHIPVAAKNALVTKLRRDIFPDRSPIGRTSVQDESDLTHIALCIHYGADGFITREEAILRKSKLLRTKYNLDILSPLELIETDLISDFAYDDVTVSVGRSPLAISKLTETDRKAATRFIESFGISRASAVASLSPEIVGTNQPCWLAKSGGDIVGLLSCLQQGIGCSIKAVLYANENAPECERVIDHFLQLVETSQVPRQLTYIDLSMSTRQSVTYETAFARGYRNLKEIPSTGEFRLGKWAYRGPLLSNDWTKFRSAFADRTNLELPERMPAFSELQHSGVYIRNLADRSTFSISLRDFETLTSTFLITADRPSVLIPIRHGYAKQLLGLQHPQRELGFTQPEAILRAERAYFCRPPGSKSLDPGAIALFYVSGAQDGNKAVVGIARITSAQRISVPTATASLARQGVLDIKDLSRVANQLNEVMAVTFDNYFGFSDEVPWNRLKSLGCIGPANLVTAQSLDIAQLESLLLSAYKDQ